MAGLTREELKAQIKEVVGPMIRESMGAEGKDIAELVRENVERSLAPLKSGGSKYVGLMFRPDEEKHVEPGISLARVARAVAAAKVSGGGPEKAVAILRGWGNIEIADKWAEAQQKALASNDPTAGGFLVPPQFSSDVIELLRAAAVVRSLNPTMLPMPTGTVKIPKITTGASAAYIGENANIGKTQQAFGQITMTWKKLAALVPISNDLVRYSSPNADSIVRDDIVRAVATREDLAFIRGDGTSGTPTGLKNWINPTNVFAANGTVSLANTTIDLGKCLQLLMAANIPMVIQQGWGTNPGGGTQASGGAAGARPGWLFSPRSYRYLTTVQNGQGFYAFRDEMLRGTLWGFPYRVTTQIPETMTAADGDTGGTQSEMYFGAFAHAVIGDALGMQVDASMEAAYYDGSTTQAAFSQDQTVIRVITEHDFALRHDLAFVRVKNMTWGS